MSEQLQELTKWPNKADGMSVDLMLRVIGADTQRLWLKKMADMEKHGPQNTPLYHAQTQAIIGAVGLMACIRELRAVSPERAEAFVRDYWGMCDGGDSFGELLWDFTSEAGLDPELVKLPSELQPTV
jgi:hypothetical protein